MTQKEKLFKTMVAAIEKENELELQYLIAKQDKDAAIKAYREYDEVENCQNLTGEPVGEGTYCGNCPYYEAAKDMLAEEKRIYCGTEDFVEFFKTTIRTLGLEEYLDYEVEDVDGEYEIRIGGNV